MTGSHAKLRAVIFDCDGLLTDDKIEAVRNPSPRAMVLMAPGWIRTALGGPDAPLTIEEAVPKVVDVLLSQRGKFGLRFLDREGSTVPW